MHRDRFRVGPLLALGLVLMIGACGGPDEVPAEEPGLTGGWSTAGCALARVPEHVTISGMRMPATPAKLDAVIARIDQAGRGDHAGSFAGLEVDQERVRALVYRVPSATFDDFIRQAAEDVCVVVRDAEHSAADLAYWHDRVVADLPYWSHQGLRIVTVGARHDGSALEIGARDAERAERELRARYGPEAPLRIVEEGPVRPLPSSTATPSD
jgi:hypothetical protein